MAERVAPESQDTSVGKSAEDLNILFPDQTLFLGNEQVTITEYPFMTWLVLKSTCADVISVFADFMQREKDIEIDELFECFENNFQTMQKLFTESIHKPVEFLEKLSDDEMQLLMLTWWSVNKHFFLRSASRQVRAATKTQSDGLM